MNVKELKHQMLVEAGLDPVFSPGSLCALSGDAHSALGEKLLTFGIKMNHIGGRNIDIIPHDVSDIDATVELSDAEKKALLTEFRALLAQVAQIQN